MPSDDLRLPEVFRTFGARLQNLHPRPRFRLLARWREVQTAVERFAVQAVEQIEHLEAEAPRSVSAEPVASSEMRSLTA